MARRGLLAERLVRPLVIVGGSEPVEAPLLGGERIGRRCGGLRLEGLVHALVPAVLLRMTGSNALDCDPQPQPPHRKPGELKQPVGRGEWDAIVGANSPGQTTLLEQALKGT